MAQAKRKQQWQTTSPVVDVPAMPASSPARILQQLLHEQAVPDGQRWSRRRSVAFVVATSSALWLTLLVAVNAATTAVA